MMITTRNETFFKVEMTAAQADCLCRFFNHLVQHNIDDVCQRGKMSLPLRDETNETIKSFTHVLQRRNGS